MFWMDSLAMVILFFMIIMPVTGISILFFHSLYKERSAKRREFRRRLSAMVTADKQCLEALARDNGVYRKLDDLLEKEIQKLGLHLPEKDWLKRAIIENRRDLERVWSNDGLGKTLEEGIKEKQKLFLESQ